MKTLRQVIDENLKNGTAVGHFNFPNFEVAQAIVDAAKKLNYPVILGLSEGERDYVGIKEAVAWVKSVNEEIEAQRNIGTQNLSNVQVFLNADHTYSFFKVAEAVEAGFDFEFTYDKKFKVYQSIGQDRTDLVFDYPGNIRNLRLPIDSSRLANRIIARGAGQGGSQYTSTVEDTVSQGTYKLRTAIVDLPTETQSANLTAKANEVIRIYALPLEIPSITLDGKLAPRVGLDFWIGDSIKLSIKEVGILETLTAVWRVEEITVNIDDNDTETISLKLSK